MRGRFRTELDDLIGDLATMARTAGQLMTDASTALQHCDLALAEQVITGDDEMTVLHEDMEQRCITLLALQAPVAIDLRTVIAAIHAVGDLKRMCHLAQHIAKIVRLKHPNQTIPVPVLPVCARMGQLAGQLAADAAAAIECRDPFSGNRLAAADDEVDALRRQLFRILFAEDWSHGVEAAVDTALIGRYYERFADHAVTIAEQVDYLTTGHRLEPHA
jgi:phosphate transport system protein